MLLRVGVIGLGRMGKLHFLNALRMKDVKVVAVADKNETQRKTVEKYKVNIYDDYTKLMDSENLDVVIISLPNFLKKDCIFYASEKNLAIFVDKPLAKNSTEAEEIIRKVEAKNARLMVGVNYRYFDSVKRLKRIFDEGRVGDCVIASSQLIMNGPFTHPLIPKPIPEWWLDKDKAGGGALLDLGYHLIDIFSWMFGDLEIEFSTLGYRFNLPIEDSATIVLKSVDTGVRCVVNVGWFSRMIFPRFNFRIDLFCTVDGVSTEQFAPRNLYFHAAKEGALNLLRRVIGRKVHYLSYTYYYASFAEILEIFFESLRKNLQFPVSLRQQLSVIKTIDEIYNRNEVS
jgi:predicted dehydrogenase